MSEDLPLRLKVTYIIYKVNYPLYNSNQTEVISYPLITGLGNFRIGTLVLNKLLIKHVSAHAAQLGINF